MRKRKKMLKLVAYVLLTTLISVILAPLTAFAQDNDKKVVRVGWYEPPFFITDKDGRRSGYAYEYQRKIAAYTGWEYEYVEGNWTELMEMLFDGRIDLMSDVSFSEERAKKILYSSLPMGTEAYYVFVSPDNTEITSENISSLNGKRIGVTKGSIQKDYFVSWCEMYDISTEIIELNSSEEEALKRLGKDFDAIVTMDVYSSPDTTVPVCKIGSSDFYFAVNKNRPDLLSELDAALNSIQDENVYYDQELHDKYMNNTETNRYLNSSEKDWLSKHSTIVVGYQDNYLAFCAQDKNTGELTGALKDYLDCASNAFENAHLKFETVAFPTAAAAIDALKNGKIDCMFPANLSDYDAEELDLVMTPPIMHSEMDAVVRASEQKEFLRKESITVAVNEGNTNYDIFLSEHFPKWNRKYYADTPTGLDAVANKEVDCVIISNYRYSNISKQCEKLHLTTVNTGVGMDYSFTLREGQPQLYSIISKVTNIVPNATINAALTYYSTEDVKTSFIDIIKENLFIVMLIIALVLMVILILLLRSIRAERKILEEEHLVKDLNKRVFVDALTSVRNKGAYNEYIEKLQNRIDSGEQLEFAIGIFDCNNLKAINDNYGHDKGDIYLKAACQLICVIFDHSPVFRIGGDEFAVILQNEDLKNREQLVEMFEKKRKEVCSSAENKWDEVHIAFGIADFDANNDTEVTDTMRRADKFMYENKRIIKSRSRRTENQKKPERLSYQGN